MSAAVGMAGPRGGAVPGGAALDLAVLLLLAAALRLLSYNGMFGSDDGTYYVRALDVATGTFSSANYNGALRYGFNLPAGALLWAFGHSPFVANLWPLACSLIEIGLVYAIATHLAGRAAGIFGALLLSFAPLHVAVATRIHADPVVSMFLTLSFVLLWFGWVQRRRALLFACGLALGGVFWAKELVAVVWFALLPFLYLFRGRWSDVGVVLAGLGLSLAADGVLMTVIAGDPLHQVKTVLGQVSRTFIGAQQGEDGSWFYFPFLSYDPRHVGLLLVAPLAGWLAWRRPLRAAPHTRSGLLFVAGWAVAVLAVLSFLPVSLSPVRLVMKQTNYITLFLAPLAVLGGVALAAIPRRRAMALAALAALAGSALALLQQADYRAFAANSKALGAWALVHPDAVVVGSTHNAALGTFWASVAGPGQPAARIVSTRALDEDAEAAAALPAEAPRWAVIDRQTVQWAARRSAVGAPLACWQAAGSLLPIDLGVGNRFAAGLAGAASALAGQVPGAAAAGDALRRLAEPAPAALYRVTGSDPLCRS